MGLGLGSVYCKKKNSHHLQNNFHTAVHGFWRTHYVSFSNFTISCIVFYHLWSQKTSEWFYPGFIMLPDWGKAHVLNPVCFSLCVRGVSCGTALRTACLISSYLTFSWLRCRRISKWHRTLHMCITLNTSLSLRSQIFTCNYILIVCIYSQLYPTFKWEKIQVEMINPREKIEFPC